MGNQHSYADFPDMLSKRKTIGACVINGAGKCVGAYDGETMQYHAFSNPLYLENVYRGIVPVLPICDVLSTEEQKQHKHCFTPIPLHASSLTSAGLPFAEPTTASLSEIETLFKNHAKHIRKVHSLDSPKRIRYQITIQDQVVALVIESVNDAKDRFLFYVLPVEPTTFYLKNVPRLAGGAFFKEQYNRSFQHFMSNAESATLSSSESANENNTSSDAADDDDDDVFPDGSNSVVDV